jgi:formylglycine-generating enzyme required for sulfatase activity
MPDRRALKLQWLVFVAVAACSALGVPVPTIASRSADAAETGNRDAGAAISHARADTSLADVDAGTIDPPPSRPQAPAGMVRIEGDDVEIGYGPGHVYGARQYTFYAPAHRVRLQPYYLDEHEVTVANYLACVGTSACKLPLRASSLESCNTRKTGRDNHPVNCINYPEAVAYCAHVGKRLPTEEEWERAARGTDGRSYPWGEGTTKKRVCWPGWNIGSLPSTCPVDMATDDVSPEGVRGLAGNVSEWTSSPACGYHDQGCQTEVRITRGGDFKISDYPSYERFGFPAPLQSNVSYGFRCAVGDEELARSK